MRRIIKEERSTTGRPTHSEPGGPARTEARAQQAQEDDRGTAVGTITDIFSLPVRRGRVIRITPVHPPLMRLFWGETTHP